MNDNQEQGLLPLEIDHLVNEIEAGDINWYLMGGNPQIGVFLAFEIGPRANLTDSVRSAILALNRKFKADREVREAMIDYAMMGGIAYHEHGNVSPRWKLDETIQ
ncbi:MULTISPECIES: hypothetical protein [Bartonella]|uniref:hypothetical protein n=1 Tax=Bartonella TaxID=773 RepID=UPI0018DD666E|nr:MULTISPECIES: hypothetical protein [Bartonella]MBH9974475.1 hypothetical protein [Bartonella choladocola]MBI0014082.1 hypothetical protein [Bartonella sp. B10834G3]